MNRSVKVAAPALALGLCAIWAWALVAETSESIPTTENLQMFSFDRVAPKKIDPVILGGVRYEQATDPGAGPDALSSGYLRAVDADSGKELWMKRIYTPDLNPTLEIDVQEVYFTALELSKDGTRLIVRNEAGKSWSVDPETGAETAIDD